jgi:CTP:phosphocholine cytidylyltransferase-like protein
MELSRNKFNMLVYLESISGKDYMPAKEEIAEKTALSIGTVNELLPRLLEDHLITQNKITGLGIQALEPYRARRAVFIAAGFGSRLVPITLNTPKPLVRVKGLRIIDTLLDAVIAAGISEILIVRGYLGEQFDQLLYKYPAVKFLENPLYNEANNISSAMCVRYQLQNAYVLESDLFLKNQNLITKYQYTSNYLGVPANRTDDWCFETRDGIISRLRVGGTNCHHMFGISYWNTCDGARLSEHIRQVYEMPGGKERYWDQVALEYFIQDYNIEVRECSFDDVIEIDTFSELKRLDETYKV